uniref:(northern house mosquito) hypothetical protein n=1 Tax=Culex pipiens TaxID=7175 RepID=A0A8D8IMQ4_CULPI
MRLFKSLSFSCESCSGSMSILAGTIRSELIRLLCLAITKARSVSSCKFCLKKTFPISSERYSNEKISWNLYGLPISSNFGLLYRQVNFLKAKNWDWSNSITSNGTFRLICAINTAQSRGISISVLVAFFALSIAAWTESTSICEWPDTMKLCFSVMFSFARENCSATKLNIIHMVMLRFWPPQRSE